MLDVGHLRRKGGRALLEHKSVICYENLIESAWVPPEGQGIAKLLRGLLPLRWDSLNAGSSFFLRVCGWRWCGGVNK